METYRKSQETALVMISVVVILIITVLMLNLLLDYAPVSVATFIKSLLLLVHAYDLFYFLPSFVLYLLLFGNFAGVGIAIYFVFSCNYWLWRHTYYQAFAGFFTPIAIAAYSTNVMLSQEELVQRQGAVFASLFFWASLGLLTINVASLIIAWDKIHTLPSSRQAMRNRYESRSTSEYDSKTSGRASVPEHVIAIIGTELIDLLPAQDGEEFWQLLFDGTRIPRISEAVAKQEWLGSETL